MEKKLKEDLSELMSHTIVPKLIKIADKYNYNRDNVVNYAAYVLTAMCEFGTFKDFKELEQEPKTDTLDKIRAEIESCREDEEPHLCDYRYHRNEGLDMALDIIDKYKAETE